MRTGTKEGKLLRVIAQSNESLGVILDNEEGTMRDRKNQKDTKDQRPVSALPLLRELCKDPNEKKELLADLQAANDAKHKLITKPNGYIDYMKLSEMITNGTW